MLLLKGHRGRSIMEGQDVAREPFEQVPDSSKEFDSPPFNPVGAGRKK